MGESFKKIEFQRQRGRPERRNKAEQKMARDVKPNKERENRRAARFKGEEDHEERIQAQNAQLAYHDLRKGKKRPNKRQQEGGSLGVMRQKKKTEAR